MTTSKKTSKLLTADDLLRLHSEGVRGELIRGVLHQTVSVGLRHGEIVIKLGFLLTLFIKPLRLGRLVGSDAGILLERSPDTVREPDIAFISAEKLPLEVDVPGYSQVVPDLAVEIFSPSDSLAAVNDKALMWLRFGVQLVWVIFPESRTLEVHSASAPPVQLGEQDQLDGGAVLPGFTCQVSEIFER
jgi:Uma2 family endonuclease